MGFQQINDNNLTSAVCGVSLIDAIQNKYEEKPRLQVFKDEYAPKCLPSEGLTCYSKSQLERIKSTLRTTVSTLVSPKARELGKLAADIQLIKHTIARDCKSAASESINSLADHILFNTHEIGAVEKQKSDLPEDVQSSFMSVMDERYLEIMKIQEAYSAFSRNFAEQIQIADHIHAQHFASAGTVGSATNPLTGMTTCSAEDFKLAVSLLHKYFPMLRAIAQTEEHERRMSYLLQVILCGTDRLAGHELPKSAYCFQINEFSNENLNALPVSIPLNMSPLEYYTQKFQRKGELKDKITNSVSQFISDVVTRTGTSFKCGDKEIACDTLENTNDAFVLNQMTKLYVDFLKSNPESIPALVEAHQQSSFLQDVRSMYDENLKEAAPFSNATLSALLRATGKAPETHEKILACGRVDEVDMQALQKSSGCSQEDIMNLVAAKHLEVMLLMHQGFISHSYKPLAEAFVPNVIVDATKRIFDFKDGSFDSLELKLPCNFTCPSELGLAFGYNPPQIVKNAVFAKADNSLVIGNIRAQNEQNVVINTVQNIVFGWRAPADIIDMFTDHVSSLPPKTIEQYSLVNTIGSSFISGASTVVGGATALAGKGLSVAGDVVSSVGNTGLAIIQGTGSSVSGLAKMAYPFFSPIKRLEDVPPTGNVESPVGRFKIANS